MSLKNTPNRTLDAKTVLQNIHIPKIIKIDTEIKQKFDGIYKELTSEKYKNLSNKKHSVNLKIAPAAKYTTNRAYYNRSNSICHGKPYDNNRVIPLPCANTFAEFNSLLAFIIERINDIDDPILDILLVNLLIVEDIITFLRGNSVQGNVICAYLANLLFTLFDILQELSFIATIPPNNPERELIITIFVIESFNSLTVPIINLLILAIQLDGRNKNFKQPLCQNTIDCSRSRNNLRTRIISIHNLTKKFPRPNIVDLINILVSQLNLLLNLSDNFCVTLLNTFLIDYNQ